MLSRYWLPSAASPLAVFNHAITYIPEFDVYVDLTAGTAQFGTLPFNKDSHANAVFEFKAIILD